MDLQPEEASGAGEAVKDRAELQSLEQEESRLVNYTTTNLKAGLEDGAYDKIEQFLSKELERHNVPREQIDTVRALVRKHEPQQINDAIHGIFGSLEVGKRHEISTDQDKQAAGEVRQGGAPVDVQPKAPEAPKPAVAPAAPTKLLPLEVQSKLFANPTTNNGPQTRRTLTKPRVSTVLQRRLGNS